MSRELINPDNIPEFVDKTKWRRYYRDPEKIDDEKEGWESFGSQPSVDIIEWESTKTVAVSVGIKDYIYFKGDDRLERAWDLAEKYRTQKI